ncbi:MAG: PepSY domain-containing protein [Planctomycetaceae bacterium]|nr:PepSY domain-containing protein [Planctomycetaceae bacterium]
MVTQQWKLSLALVLAISACASTAVFARESRISEESARQAALAQVDGGRVVRSETERRRGGRTVYDYVIVDDNNRYKIRIDGDSGETREFSRKAIRNDRRERRERREREPRVERLEGERGARLSLDEAQRIALDRVGGGRVVEAKRKDRKHGRDRYTFEIIHNGYEYEIEMNARTGEVVKFDRDHDDDDDDWDDDDDDDDDDWDD